MKVLVSNDDGVHSASTLMVASKLSEMGFEVMVAAPLGDWSGASKSIGGLGSVKVYELDLEGGVTGIAADAPPARMVAIAIDVYGFKPDIVFSGVNYGPNIGVYDVLSSGTVGAVIEAVLRGFKGIAASSGCSREELSCVRKVSAISADFVLALEGWIRDVENVSMVAINIPPGRIEGVRVTMLSYRRPFVNAVRKEWGLAFRKIDHARVYGGDSGDFDGGAYSRGYITLTPLKVSQEGFYVVRDHDVVESLAAAAQDLGSSLRASHPEASP